MRSQIWRWTLGLIYIVAVASIWIAASYVVQSVVDEGVSPFIITYICNSLFIVYIPLFEIGRYLEDTCGSICFWKKKNSCISQELKNSEEAVFIEKRDFSTKFDGSNSGGPLKDIQFCQQLGANDLDVSDELESILFGQLEVSRDSINQVDSQGRWTRTRMARVSLLICPFWFLAQLSFNFSLKYTTVTSNTILSSASSLFTYLVSLAFLGEKFTWMKLVSVLLCMGGTIIVSLGDSSAVNSVAKNPVLGDILALLSAALYAVYITLIRKKLPDDDENSSKASMAQFLGYMGVFNLLIFLPVALILNFTKLEPFDVLNWEEFGLIVGKGLLDNVLSDYLWAKAVLLTTTTVATAGLTIQVPLAAMVDTLTGNAPNIIDYVGAAVVMVGFAGINIPSDAFYKAKEASIGL